MYNNLHHSRNIAGSNFRSLSNIPHCRHKSMPGPCFSSSVIDHPLRSIKDCRYNIKINKPNLI